MSGQIIKDNAKGDIKRFLPQKGHTTITSAATPPPLPSRTSGKIVKSPTASTKPRNLPPSPMTEYACPKCGLPDGKCGHNYEEIFPQGHQEQNQYEQPFTAEESKDGNISARLRKIEDNQMRMRNEFNDFRDIVDNRMKSLEVSFKRLMDTVDSLDDSIRESFAHQQSLTDNMFVKLLESSDHLGKQILDVKKDINTALFRSGGSSQLKKYTHTFEWDVGNLESMMKHQQNSSSQSYLIGQVDFKILGGAACTRDGRLCVKMFGEFTHVPMNIWEKKNGNFECAAYIVDKSGGKPDFLVGKVTGDFNKEKTWMLGEVPASEITVKGYTTGGGNVSMKFIIEGYA